MTSNHAFDRYNQAAFNLEHARETLNKFQELSGRIIEELRDPSHIKVEGIGNWEQIRNNPDTFTEADWFSFDRFRGAIEYYQNAKAAEARAWDDLSQEQKKRILRPIGLR